MQERNGLVREREMDYYYYCYYQRERLLQRLLKDIYRESREFKEMDGLLEIVKKRQRDGYDYY